MRQHRYTGEKLYLTALAKDDAPAITKWLNDPDVTIFMDEHREMKTLEKVQTQVEEWIKTGEAFAIFDKATDMIIGYSHSLPYILIGEPDYWYKGYDEESLAFLLDFGFNIRNHNILTVSAYSHNIRALQCYANVGFTKAVTYRQRMLRGRDKFDLIYMDFLASDYFAKCAKEVVT